MIFMIQAWWDTLLAASRDASNRYHRRVTVAAPPLEPVGLRHHLLPVRGGHVLQVLESGRADGLPALVLHGGPGSGCSALLHRFFDPQRYRVICVDQRGSGGSRPRGGIENNTTDDLIADLRLVRERLGVRRWLVCGGSWGAALALAYAAAEPETIDALLLRSTFLARREDIVWFFHGAACEAPQAWARFAAAAPAECRGNLLAGYVQMLHRAGPAVQARAALAWWGWEQTLSGAPPVLAAPQGDALAALVDRYRVQSHYLEHDCWLAAPPLLERCAALPCVPTLLLHARNDRVCRPSGASALRAHLPHSRLRWIDGAGHDPAHPAMLSAMTSALDDYAMHRSFSGGSRA